MDETYGTYVDDECFDIHDYDDDTDHDTVDEADSGANDDTHDDTDDDDANDDTDDDTDGGRGNRRPLLEGAEFISQMIIYDETLILDLVLSRNKL